MTWCEFRRRWRGIVALTMFVGVVGAIVLATAAGARRSDTALDRFKTFSRSGDVELTIGSSITPAQLRAVRREPGVAAVAVLNGVGIVIPRAPDLTAIAAAVDSKFGSVVDRSRIVAGRAANPNAANEVTIGESLAAQLHLRVGDHLDAVSYTVAQAAAGVAGADPGAPAGPKVQFRIVGIERRPLDLADRGASGGVVVLTPGFNRAYANKTVGSFGTTLRIRTRHGAADVAGVVAAGRRIFTDAAYFQVQPLNIESEGARGAIDVLTVALWIFAGIAALAGVTAIGIVLTREITLASIDQSTLHALGLTRRERVTTNGCPALPIAGGGALLAVLGAVVASPLFPIGAARRADPDAGLHVDWLVVGSGFVVVILVVLSIAVLAAWRSTRTSSFAPDAGARVRTSRLVERASRAGLSPVPTNGVRMALEPGRGRTAVPVRSACLGAVFGIVGLTAVFIFASSVDHLVTTPPLYGWTFDFAATDNAATACPGTGVDYGLSHRSGIVAVAGVCGQTVQLDGHPVSAQSFTDLRGTIEPEIIAGRAPRGTGEVALGSATLQTLGKHIGDTVRGRGPNAQFDYRIVGRAVLATIGSNNVQPLADGAVFSTTGLHRVEDSDSGYRYLVVRFGSGVDRAVVERRIAGIRQLTNLTRPVVPAEVERLRQIDWFPTTIAALLAGLALLAVGHALVTAVRRRRRDLALLKTLGFNRRQVRATIAWQATTLAAVGLVLGIPAGLILGEFVWRVVANGIGVSTSAAIPVLILLLTAPAVLALVNLVAFFPARTAARTRPAVALRTE